MIFYIKCKTKDNHCFYLTLFLFIFKCFLVPVFFFFSMFSTPHFQSKKTIILSIYHSNMTLTRHQSIAVSIGEKSLLVAVDFSQRRCSVKKAVLKNFAIFSQYLHLCWSFFLIKQQALRLVILLKMNVAVNIAKLLRTPILKNICEQLLLSLTLLNFFGNVLNNSEILAACATFFKASLLYKLDNDVIIYC